MNNSSCIIFQIYSISLVLHWSFTAPFAVTSGFRCKMSDKFESVMNISLFLLYHIMCWPIIDLEMFVPCYSTFITSLISGHHSTFTLRTQEELSVNLQNGNSNGVHSDVQCDKESDDEVNTYCELYDEHTKDVLKVEFPPFYFSTHGLSRPSTPLQEDSER